MRKTTISMLFLLLSIAIVGCGGDKKGTPEAGASEQANTNQEVSVESSIRMDPLPFKTVLGGLQDVSKELAYMTPKEAYKVDENVYKQAFAMGVISADAVMTISSREEDKLKQYTESLIYYSKNVELGDEILKMADEIQTTLSKTDSNKWDELEKLVLKYQHEVENTFYQKGLLDQFTLMQLGGWTEGLNKITGLYLNNWDENGVKIINQQGITNSLINNLNSIRSKKVKELDVYGVSTEGYKHIKELITLTAERKSYTKDEVKQINEITNKILSSL